VATFGSIQTAVEGNLIDLPSFVSGSVPGLINRAYRKAMSLHNFWIMRAEQDYTTTLATRALGTVPSNWKEWRGKPYLTEDTGIKRPLLLAPSLEAARGRWDAEDESEPEGLAEALASADTGTVSLNVYPLPDGNSDYDDGEYRITVPYWKYLAELSADADTNWIVTEGEDWLEAEATRQGFMKDWDEDRAKFWQTEASRTWKDLLLRDKYKWLSMSETMAVYDGPYDIPSE
jgi:hypothetical protein